MPSFRVSSSALSGDSGRACAESMAVHVGTLEVPVWASWVAMSSPVVYACGRFAPGEVRSTCAQ